MNNTYFVPLFFYCLFYQIRYTKTKWVHHYLSLILAPPLLYGHNSITSPFILIHPKNLASPRITYSPIISSETSHLTAAFEFLAIPNGPHRSFSRDNLIAASSPQKVANPGGRHPLF